ncbi:midasin-like [Haliotis rufescens]|uniref:midasin-like n=1 Tax=Haliotis rufescens TaxID=6454 RepID=UPI00201F9C32|nr:midasin-like [Haliotis rufescens]
MEDRDSSLYSMVNAVHSLCEKNAKCNSKLRWLLSKLIWQPSDRTALLESLSQLFLDVNCSADICICVRPLILDVIERSKTSVLLHGHENNIYITKFAVALSLGVRSTPDLRNFSVEFLNAYKPFCQSPNTDEGEPRKKKKKKEKLSDLELSRAMWTFLDVLGESVEGCITLDLLVSYLSHHEPQVRWFAAEAVSQLVRMSESQRGMFLRKYFTEEEIRELSVRFSLEDSPRKQAECLVAVSTGLKSLSHTMQGLVSMDYSDSVVEVAGLLLPRLQGETTTTESVELVPVRSMLSNLRSLALAVVSGAPVLLQGPVGSGKTSLVQHLAGLTGRHTTPHLIKIQLGDQTDSKALLGTYRCTEVPGEFVWQPGILTRAVTEGFWVLLEDIDFAPMDVVSILLPLLETNTLTVPGHGDNVKANPGFRLFATQRLVGSSSGWHRQRSGSALLLEKMWTRINVEPLSRSELEKVIVSRFPQLATVVEKLLDIYLMLSAGKHDSETSTSNSDGAGKFLSLAGRLVSTRDLMTWINRVSSEFDVSSTDAGAKVFQEALDCFVSCLPKPSKRMPLAEAIGAKLNVSKIKTEFYICKYKPIIEVSESSFTAGRVVLPRKPADVMTMNRVSPPTFAYTRQSVCLLEKVSVCVSRNEPVLLVGETGTGKTSSVQFLAHQLGHKLHVINLNQQSDSTDLLGGFKPVDLKFVIMPFREDFEMLFMKTFSRKQNTRFLGHIQECFSRRKWSDLLTLMDHTQKSATKKFDKGTEEHRQWKKMGRRLHQLKVQVQQIENALAFSFIEGTLVKALRAGDWVLLDEINLAAAETLECLSGLLESTSGSVVLTERGDVDPVVRHREFRLFACMNPATDIGKKDLTPGIRNRFTELYVDELEDTQDLKILTNDYLRGLSLSSLQVDGIVKFYLTVRNEAHKRLTDGTGHKPHFSLRTLCRALKFASSNPCSLVARSLYEGFCLSFLTQLDRSSHPVVEKLVCQHVVGKSNIKAILKQPLPQPPGAKHLNFEGYWISQGALEPHVPDNYILTPSVRENLRDLARVISASQHPVLLQGETSVGKTSLIMWLARSSGNPCVRVNNHEHTDLQEYVGCYAADESGKLVFKEGVLVEAMRRGHWIILDELNLAPTDVLEALNRLLDDNRELFIPETQETVKAHPKFMLFATQNPPGMYGGRKMLSRAFRNRFIELHFNEIPSIELETILHQRCNIPLSYAKRLVKVMLELQMRRRGSGVFAGKQGFMTLRDLFRWAERYSSTDVKTSTKFYDWDQHLADHGYMLLAGRVRKAEESVVIQEVLKKYLKRDVNDRLLFDLTRRTSSSTAPMLKEVTDQSVEGFQHIVWTHNMRRLAVLIGQAIKFREPVLLVGETGCGKTTVCQLYAAMRGRHLFSVNCHLHTESADFLGGLRPVRSHTEQDDPKEVKLFEWLDGPLVTAMKEGSMFLIDEISLADDSVLERLNSVLEPEQTLLLAEKGGGDGGSNEVEQIKAAGGFQVYATMNPGGDFGKKELSPALRNRFTEIWCPPTCQRDDLEEIIEHNIREGLQLGNQQDGTTGFGAAILDFIEWFSNNEIGKKCTVSIRDILTWVHFINTCATPDLGEVSMETSDSGLDPVKAYIHGACLVFLDSLGSGTSSQRADFNIEVARDTCLQFLVKQINSFGGHDYNMADLNLCLQKEAAGKMAVISTDEVFSIPPFSIPRGDVHSESGTKYALQAPTTCMNAQRVLRALQLPRPLLLEGSPGVGKTSLVTAIARSAGRELVRINLSEQTDVTDLFGADLPVEGAEGGRFAWRDGPLLQALKAGHWVVLDELNLASQSVLEGLNACLDHRAEVFIPELGKTFTIQHEQTRLFACQNPLSQGGGRKGLPRSFLNRFTQVYIEPLSRGDLLFIAESMFPVISGDILTAMVDFNMALHNQTMMQGLWGHRGGPWEFNLRDLFRWCELLLANQVPGDFDPGEYVRLVYADRMRTLADKAKVSEVYNTHFSGLNMKEVYGGSRYIGVGVRQVQIGHAFLRRSACDPTSGRQVSLQVLHHHLEPLESIAKCVQMNWMAVLVGPQSCGKSSMVRLLSELTGTTLHVLPMNSAMDTTELLGGFEQADIFRYVEEVGAEVERIVKRVQRTLLCEHTTLTSTTVQTLDREWSIYTNLTTQGTGASTVEEYECLKAKVKAICSLLMLLHKIHDQNKLMPGGLEELQSRADHLCGVVGSERLSSAGSGGTFEWVDSLLVKALQNGDWLLIDNVNFCSPSVLDRLNALLEPGGVLSINERGVIDGQIPAIKPHANFRLFLAMDPKFGEISRAMRNRGVEIYIPGEDDGCPYSTCDTKRMMKGLGLHDKALCDWLVDLHATMKERLPRPDQPVLVDLLCVSAMMVQQVDRGVSRDKALYHAANDVYVRSLKTTLSKQVAMEILTERVKTFQNDGTTGQVDDCELGLWPLSLCGTHDYWRNTALANVQNPAGTLFYLVGQIKSTWAITEDLDCSMITKLTTKLRMAAELYMSLLPERGWQTASTWLQRLMGHLLLDMRELPAIKGRHGWALENYVRALPGVLALCLKQVSEQPISLQYRNALHALCEGQAEVDSVLVDQPWHVVWNPHLLQHLRRQRCPEGDQDWYQLTDNLHTLSYKVCLLLHLTLVFRDLQPMVETLSGLQHTVSQGFATSTAIVHLSNMYEEMETELSALVEKMDVVSEATFTKILSCLPWMCRLLCLAQRWQQMTLQTFTCQLALHWNWFNNKTLATLTSLGSTSSSSKLQSAVTQLQRTLGQDNMSAKQFERFWNDFGHPAAMMSECEAMLTRRLQALVNLVSMYEEAPSGVVLNKVKAMVHSGYLVRKQILELSGLIRNIETTTENIEDLFEKVRTCLGCHNLHLTSDTDMWTSDNVPPAPETTAEPTLPFGFVELWPLFEHLNVMSHLSLLPGVPADSSHLSHLQDYCLHYTPDTLMHLELMKKTQEQDAGRDVTFSKSILNMLWRSTASRNCRQWLQWNKTKDDQAETETELSLGPGMFQTSAVSYFAFSLLSRDHSCQSEAECLPVDVPLKHFDYQLRVLELIRQHVWSHASILACPERSVKNQTSKYLFRSFIHLLDSIKSLLTPADRVQYAAVFDELQSSVKQTALTSAVIRRAHSCLQCVTDSIDPAAVPVLHRSCEILHDLTQDDGGDSLSNIGRGLVYVGLSHMVLLAPRGPVDPVEKQAVKLEHLQDELSDVEAELEAVELQLQLLTGRGLAESICPHPRVRFLLQRQQTLTQKVTDLQKRKVYRPQESQFHLLVQDITSFLQSVGSTDHVTDLLSKLLSANQMLQDQLRGDITATSCVREERVWQTTLHRFLQRLEQEYPCYKDLLEPFTLAMLQVSLGMRMIAQEVDLLAQKVKFESLSTPEQTVICLSRFPAIHPQSPSMLQMAEMLVADVTWRAVGRFTQQRDTDTATVQEKEICSKLLKDAVLLVKTHCLMSGELSPQLTFTLSRLFELFVRAWQEQEEARRRKEEEKQALYRYKSQTHGDDRSDEQKEEEDFRASFPSFEKDFEDVIGLKSLEGTGDDQEEITHDDVSPGVDRISPSEMSLILDCHRKIFTTLTSTEWIRRPELPQVLPQDHVLPALTRYSVAAQLGKMGWNALDSTVDVESLGGHLLVCGAVQTSVRVGQSADGETHNPLLPKESPVYNIYTDSNVAEVIQCRPVLTRFSARVSELQQEWPDHPTLKVLQTIVDRVLSFPVTCPVMKFLTGLELLLEKSQDWEANAAAHVSMATQLADVTTMIIQWRKLELSCWNRSLDTQIENVRSKASQWWFYIYQLIGSFLSPQQQDDIPEPSAEDILKSLEQFLETSSLGEFRCRLELVYTFHCQLTHMDKSPKQDVLLNLLWNVYQFYGQFLDGVEADVTRQRAPIERELKGFVKIARWNDMSYWALKQTTEKTHKTVHKYSKAFQTILQKPVRDLLTEKGDNSDLESDPQVNCGDRLQEYSRKAASKMLVKQKHQPDMATAPASAGSLQSRLPSLTTRVQKHWRRTLSNMRYTQLTTVLDEFTGEIIESVHELQAEEVTPGLDKEHQKSEAKLMNLRKRKSLADLFQHLTTAGLSYRKGLTMAEDTGKAMLVSPIDVVAGVEEESTELSGLWSGCLKYYYRCVARRARLTAALHTPSKELGLGNISRCRGFVEHLMHILTGQHQELSAIFKQYLQLRNLMASVSKLQIKASLPPQKKTREWIDKLKHLSVQLLEGLNQYLVLLYTCPQQVDGARLYPSPYPPEELSPMALLHQGDEGWTSCVQTVRDMLKVAETEQGKVLAIGHVCYQWSDLELLQDTVTEYGKLIPLMSELSSKFNDPISNTGCCLNQTLDYLGDQLQSVCRDFQAWVADTDSLRQMDTDSSSPHSAQREKFSDGVEGVIAAALLAVQNLVKAHGKPEDKEEKLEEKQEGEEEEEEESTFQKGHLTKLLVEPMSADLQLLQYNKVTEFLTSLVNILKIMVDNAADGGRHDSSVCLRQLLRCCPMMHQYVDMVEYFVAHLIGLFRTTGKLLSVLLGLFSELAAKGFCIPPEFSDELGGEGATDFEDITGGGLGDGQGAKDVSDQIETEDQLDEARRQGEEQKDDANQPDVAPEDKAIEMSEDFEGQLDDAEMKDGDDSDQEEPDTEELDKKMGDVDSKDTDRLDEQMWGSDDEEEEEQEKENSKEESGPGAGQESESQVVAKDDNQDKTEAEDNQKSERDEQKDGEEENREEQKPHELEEFDENEYDEDKIDPHHGNQGPEQEPEALDLPEDLNLDENEAGKDEDENQPSEMDPDNQDGGGEDVEEQTDVPDTEEGEKKEREEENMEEDEQKDETEGKEGEDKPQSDDHDQDKTAEDEEEGKGESGVSPQDEDNPDTPEEETKKDGEPEDSVEAADERGRTSHDTDSAQMTDTAQDEAATGDNDQKEQQGMGVSVTQEQEGHEGESSSQVTDGTAPQHKKQYKRRPGQSDQDHSLGSREEKYKKLKTVDRTSEDSQEKENKPQKESDLYEHIKESSSQYDAQTLDVATAEQQEEQPVANQNEEEAEPMGEDDDLELQENLQENKDEKTEMKEASKLSGKDSKRTTEDGGEEDMEVEDERKGQVEGEKVLTMGAARGPESTIHTVLEHLHLEAGLGELDEEKLRAELEENIAAWSHLQAATPQEQAAAAEAWQQYDALTASLAQDLCEQLRLVLEPSQATKLRGDYRTGKRLNMRKVIPYIASQFRKDKIWLRRTKPSKRQYQIMLAIDDSSSMVDNHSKQLAFESLAMISNALTLLESGELAVCSFGECVRQLHPFSEQFTNQSGAGILQHFTFEQKKTKIAQLLQQATSIMVDARQRQQGTVGQPETSQLLLIVSDGRGLFNEGMEVVQSAVRQAREANIFLVFVIIDNPQSKDSILDIKVPVFKGAGQLPEIRSYMESFPFPFYIILRDINSLPQTLSDALRQWFELVTAGDRV